MQAVSAAGEGKDSMADDGGSSVEAVPDGCVTPNTGECLSPRAVICPPPPRKKRPVEYRRSRDPPKNGYFQPPDLESLFSLAAPRRRREACA